VTDLPSTGLASVVDRIEAPTASTADLPADVTGALADLLRWWQGVSDGSAPVAVQIHVSPGEASVDDAIDAGIAAAERAIDAGATMLVPRVNDRDDVAARTVISLLTRREASVILPQGANTTDREWMTACASIRDLAADAAEHRGSPVALLDHLGAQCIAGVVGVLLASAARRTPCLLDGTDELAAALVADRLCYRAKGWWRPGSDSPDPGRAAAISRIDLASGLPLALSDDAGRGAQSALALLDLLDEGR
jgi:nicotinate-nucleotide--dimethylbenzimidazole phosphoribosyltransferase